MVAELGFVPSLTSQAALLLLGCKGASLSHHSPLHESPANSPTLRSNDVNHSQASLSGTWVPRVHCLCPGMSQPSAGTVGMNAEVLLDPNHKGPEARGATWAEALLHPDHGPMPCHAGLAVRAAAGLGKQKVNWCYM